MGPSVRIVPERPEIFEVPNCEIHKCRWCGTGKLFGLRKNLTECIRAGNEERPEEDDKVLLQLHQ